MHSVAQVLKYFMGQAVVADAQGLATARPADIATCSLMVQLLMCSKSCPADWRGMRHPA